MGSRYGFYTWFSDQSFIHLSLQLSSIEASASLFGENLWKLGGAIGNNDKKNDTSIFSSLLEGKYEYVLGSKLPVDGKVSTWA